MPRWTQNDITRLKQRNPNIVPSGQVPDAKPQRNKAKPLGKATEGKARSLGCVRGRTAVRFTLRRVRPLDPDAAAGSSKDLLDGLRHSKLLSDDNPWEISLTVDQEKVAHYEEEETLIYITYP